MLTEPERDALLARLATALEGLDTQRETGWFDSKTVFSNLLSWLGGAAVAGLIGFFGVGGYQERLRVVETSASQNSGEVRRVEADSRERDRDLGGRLDKVISDHMQYQHGGRRSSASAGGSTTAAEPIVIRRPTPGELRAMMAAGHGGGR